MGNGYMFSHTLTEHHIPPFHSSHQFCTKVTWEWHGMTSSSSPFTYLHSLIHIKEPSFVMGEMKQKHLDPLESGPHCFQPQANSIIWVAQIYTATRSGPDHGSGRQVGPTTWLTPNQFSPHSQPLWSTHWMVGHGYPLPTRPAPLKSPVGPPSDPWIRFIIIWPTWAHNPTHGYRLQRYQSQMWFYWWICHKT